MAIRLGCKCGQQLITEEAYIGQTIRCPACNILIRVPNVQKAAPPAPAPASYPQAASAPPAGYAQPQPPPTYPQQAAPPNFLPPPATPPQYPPAPLPPQASFPATAYQLPAPQQYMQAGFAPGAPLAPPEHDQPILDEGEELGEDEAEKERSKKEKRKARRRQLKICALGVSLIHWSLMCLLGALACLVIMVIICFIALQIAMYSALGGNPLGPDFLAGPGSLSLILLFGFFTLTFVHGILYIVGSVLCCWVPPKSKARPYVIISVSMIGAAFLLMLIQFFMMVAAALAGTGALASLGSALAAIFGILSALLIPAGFVMFMLFLRILAYYLNERSTGDEVISILGVWIGLFIIIFPTLFVAFGLTIFIPFAGSWVAIVMLAVWFGFWVKQWIRLLNVVGAVRQVMSYEFGV